VRLVVGLSRNDLHCSDDAACVAGDEQHPNAARHIGGKAPPKSHGLVASERKHEIDGRSSGNAIDQNIRQLLDVGIRERGQQANCNVIAASGCHDITR
jgi:hypothetical protein